MGYAATCPWIGVFDPDITLHGKEGLYLAYIYAADFGTVTLTLQQGVDGLADKSKGGLGRGQKLRQRLSKNAEALASRISGEMLRGWDSQIDLKVPLGVLRPQAYEAGNIRSQRYDLAQLPTEEELSWSDLWRAESLLQHAAQVPHHLWGLRRLIRRWLQCAPGVFTRGEECELLRRWSWVCRARWFSAKDATEYRADIGAHTLYRERRHEKLVNEFAEYVHSRGYLPQTEKKYPRDLTLHHSEMPGEWLVEAKVSKGGIQHMRYGKLSVNFLSIDISTT